MRKMPISDVRTRFATLADEVAATRDRVVVTRNGWPVVMLISVEDFEALNEGRAVTAPPTEQAARPEATDDAR